MSACQVDELHMQKKYFANFSEGVVKKLNHELQFDFFLSEDESEVDRLIRMTEEIKDSTGKVRRKLFGENAQLKKRVLDLEERLLAIERGLCYGQNKLFI